MHLLVDSILVVVKNECRAELHHKRVGDFLAP